MRQARIAYLVGAVGLLGSKIVGAIAGFGSLWLLTQMLTKEQLGGYAFAMSIAVLGSVVGTIGLNRALLLRISQLRQRSVLMGSGLALRTGLAAIFAGCVLTAVIILVVVPLPHLNDIGAQEWLPVVSFVVPFAVAGVLASVWFQANHRVFEATVANGLPDLFRFLFFILYSYYTKGKCNNEKKIQKTFNTYRCGHSLPPMV